MSTQFVHLANFLSAGRIDIKVVNLGILKEGRVTTLETFWKTKEITKLLDANPTIKIFLDSGAHSLLNAQVGLINTGATVKTEKKTDEDGNVTFTGDEFQGRLDSNQRIHYSKHVSGAPQFFADFSFNDNSDVRQYLDNYIEFIKKYANQLMAYVNLDIIYNADESWKNQMCMESKGLRPIPVYHFGEDIKHWKRMVDEYDYIGIGGVAGGVTLNQFVNFADPAFEYLWKKKPDCKVHGFAVTSHQLMIRYPFWSVDSTTWLKHAAYGNVMAPHFSEEKQDFDYFQPPIIYSVSDVSLIKATKNPHYTLSCSPKEIERVEEYFRRAGADLARLKVDLLERFKVNTYYYEELLKDPRIHERKPFYRTKSFF
jgi:hypothetical protein